MSATSINTVNNETTVDPAVGRLAFDEAVRTLQHQYQEVCQARDRGVSLVKLASGSTAIVAASSILRDDTNPPRVVNFLIVVGTLVLLVFFVYVWRMFRVVNNFKIEADARDIIDNYGSMTSTDAYIEMAYNYGAAQDENEARIQPLRQSYSVALRLAALQTVIWAMVVLAVALG